VIGEVGKREVYISYAHKPISANERKMVYIATWSFQQARNPKYRVMIVSKQPHRNVVGLSHPRAELIYLKFIFPIALFTTVELVRYIYF